jgi:CMP/dCMP kinase
MTENNHPHPLESLPITDQIDILSEKLRETPWKIGIDGPAAAGKGTLADLLVEHLGLEKIETGKMYRAVTYYLREMKYLTIDDLFHLSTPEIELCEHLKGLKIIIQRGEDDLQHVYIHTSQMREDEKRDITDKLEDPGIGKRITYVAKRDQVRDLVEKQQNILLKEGKKVIEGRDMWQTAKKHVDAIFYIYADDESLIKREMERQIKRGKLITEDEAREIVVKRNQADNHRRRGKLLTPEEAIKSKRYDAIIDTSGCSPEAVLLQILDVLNDKMMPSKKRLTSAVEDWFRKII